MSRILSPDHLMPINENLLPAIEHPVCPAEFSSPRFLDELTALASHAATTILSFDRSHIGWRSKPDSSPVTAADEAAEDVILAGLSCLLPGMRVVSEEPWDPAGTDSGEADFILVDPLDGTREYLAGRSEFTVNIGLIIGHVATVGVIAAPDLGKIWRGVLGKGSDRLRLSPGAGPTHGGTPVPIRTRKPQPGRVVAMVSRSHFDPRTDAFLSSRSVTGRVACGSSLKFCRIAEGRADLYARLGPTSQWDIAAGHAILAAAGGAVTTPDSGLLNYGFGPAGFAVPGFVAWGHQPAG